MHAALTKVGVPASFIRPRGRWNRAPQFLGQDDAPCLRLKSHHREAGRMVTQLLTRGG
jgi:hypothetical protein